MIVDKNIDGGKAFDWGRASEDYAKYRDIYPVEFYEYLLGQNLCTKGQKVLDIGTGTGVIPRNMYRFGAKFTGTDISDNQIEQARRLSAEAGMEIEYFCSPAEDMEFADESFDVVTACQCFTYFDHPVLAPKLSRMLKAGGRFAVLYMAWLPNEDSIAGASEQLVLNYNPKWTGCGETRHPIQVPETYDRYFEVESSDVFDVHVPFTRESWNGRMKACRGIGASLAGDEVAAFEREHLEWLGEHAAETFEILHYAAVTVLRKKQK